MRAPAAILLGFLLLLPFGRDARAGSALSATLGLGGSTLVTPDVDVDHNGLGACLQLFLRASPRVDVGLELGHCALGSADLVPDLRAHPLYLLVGTASSGEPGSRRTYAEHVSVLVRSRTTRGWVCPMLVGGIGFYALRQPSPWGTWAEVGDPGVEFGVGLRVRPARSDLSLYCQGSLHALLLGETKPSWAFFSGGLGFR
jgi:hypothetical protein